MKMAESEKPEVDAVDQDELDELEREILGLERSGSDSDDSSSCDSDNKKKKSSLVVKKKGMATTACIMCKYNVV